jgi:hypothetical protein
MKYVAFTLRKNGFDVYAIIKIGTMVKSFFKNLKDFIASSFNFNLSLHVYHVKGATFFIILYSIKLFFFFISLNLCINT